MDLTKEVRRTGVNVNEEETFFKMFKALYERPAYKKTLDGTDREIYCLLAERYNFFYSLEYHESCVKTSDGRFGIKYSESKLADYLGVGRNKVSLSIQKLEALGLISVERCAKKASIYVIHDIPNEVSEEALKRVKDVLKKYKERNKKYNNKNLLHMKQDDHASYRASNKEGNDDDLLHIEQDPCFIQSKNMLHIEQDLASYEYSNKNKEKDTSIRTPEPGTASLSESACPPAINNNTNDGIPGEVDAISVEGLSLPSKKDNTALSDMMSPSEQNTIVVTPSNTDRNNDGIKQREQSLPGSPTQHGINNNSTAAAASQNLPEEKTLREWLADHCKIRWIIDAALTKLDGDQTMPREHTPDWDALMQQVAAALPTLRDVLAKCGIHPDNITTLERFCRDKNKPFTAETVIGTLCGPSAKDKLMVYILAGEYKEI